MAEVVFGLIIVLVVLWAGYCKWKSDKELKEPLYIRYKDELFHMAPWATITFNKECVCSICRKYEKCTKYSNLLQLCSTCKEKLRSIEVLKEQGISLDEIGGESKNYKLLYGLNLVQIDLQRGSIMESEAKHITNEITREMIENATYYKIAKKAVGGQRLTHDKVSVTYTSAGEDLECRICGHIEHFSCSLCEKTYELDLEAKKFPKKLKEVLNKIDDLTKDGIWSGADIKNFYTYYDWRYLNLIAKDIERGFIEKPEALSEAERYIDLIYNDIKNVPEELAAKKNAPPKPVVKTESEKFMDDILS